MATRPGGRGQSLGNSSLGGSSQESAFGGSGGSSIPASARDTVQRLKDMVSNTEEEIYAALKECGMDPNRAAERLLNQGMRLALRRAVESCVLLRPRLL